MKLKVIYLALALVLVFSTAAVVLPTPKAEAQSASWETKRSLPQTMTGPGSVAVLGKIHTISKTTSSGPSLHFEYNPITDEWAQKATPPLSDRYGMGSAVYNDKIYLFGGVEHGGPLSNVAIYDPTTESWSTGTSMPVSSAHSTATVVADKIYVVAGTSPSFGDSGGSDVLQIYDPATDSWSTGANMPTKRQSAMAAAVNDKIYVIGGNSGSTRYNVVEEYDPATDTWNTRTPIPTAGQDGVAAVVNDKIFVMGAIGLDGTVYIYNPCTDAWSTGPDMPTPRYALADSSDAVLNGAIYVVGGQTASGYVTTVEALRTTPTSVSWETKRPLPQAMVMPNSVAVLGKIHSISKVDGSGPSLHHEYNPITDEWVQKTTPPLSDRYGMGSAVYNDKIYLFGGVEHGGPLSNVAIYDPATDSWSTGTSMPAASSHSTATVVGDKIYVVSGTVPGFGDAGGSDVLQIYDPATDSWSTGANMPTKRQGAMAAAVNDKIYVIGGYSWSTIYDVVEEYDPATDTWNTRTPIPTAGNFGIAAVMNDKIFVMASYYFGGTVYVYDPCTDTWSTGPDMPTPRYDFSDSSDAVLNDAIYVVDGAISGIGRVTTVEALLMGGANSAPNQPNNTSPTNGATDVSLTSTLTSSAFSDPDAGDTHYASQWQITTTSGDYSSPIYTTIDLVNLESIPITPGALNYGVEYFWHVRHQDNHGAWSAWSTETSFTTYIEKIAFATDIHGNFQIYVMDEDGNNRVRLTNNAANDRYPRWSPDGSQIAFSSDRDGDYEIYVMDYSDPSSLTQVTFDPGKDSHPTWSPDGNQLAFDSNRYGSEEIYRVYVNDLANPIRLTNDPANCQLPSWSPDGTQIAFSGDSEIWVMDAYVPNSHTTITSSYGDRFPVWSPDGTQFAFATRRNYIVEIYLMDTDGSNQTKLTSVYVDDFYPTWSPDGSKIAVQSQPAGGSPWQIYVMDSTDGSNRINLSNNSAQEVDPAYIGPSAPTPTDNTPVGPDVPVSLSCATATFDNVTVEGTTACSTQQGNPYPTMPEGFRVRGQFVDITTDATYDQPGVEVCIPYDPSEPNPENLKLFHWEGGHWVDVTTHVDTDNYLVCGYVTSLSWFFIGGQWVWVDDVPVFPTWYIGIAAALGAGVLAYLYRRRILGQRTEGG